MQAVRTLPAPTGPANIIRTALLDGVSPDMNVDGSVAAVTFLYIATKETVISSVKLVITDGAGATPGTFGTLAALGNGVTVNVMRSAASILDLCFGSIVDNLPALAMDGGMIFQDKQATLDAVTIELIDRPILLVAGDSIDAIVNDDLTGLTLFMTLVRGYYR